LTNIVPIEDFVKRFAGRDNNPESLKQGLNLMRDFYDILKTKLNKQERKSFLVILKYLEAKNMRGV
jgi:hypothetical protein